MAEARRVILGLSVAMGLALAIGGTTGFAAAARNIHMMDNCDPATFNAAIGPGTCTQKGGGGVPFPVFISELVHTGKAGAWLFTPNPVHLEEDEEFIATNYGGEDHTFTEVDEFGGGFVDQLNTILGLTPTPECLAVAANLPAGLIAPGASTAPEDEEPGVHHYQCCIHPWMRTDIIVR